MDKRKQDILSKQFWSKSEAWHEKKIYSKGSFLQTSEVGGAKDTQDFICIVY